MSYISKQTAPESQRLESGSNKVASPQFTDQRSSTSMQLKQQQLMGASKANPLQRAEDEELLQGKFATAQLIEEEEPLQRKFETAQLVEEEELLQGKFSNTATTQLEPKPNNTGLPDNLKSGVENLSGYSMDDVKVHYNSGKPSDLQAHAYAQGTDIHVAPGQEQHLPHEAWHVVQQKQGRVQPTMQMKAGVPVNDDVGLETEADVMGAKAVATGTSVALQKVSQKPQASSVDAKQLRSSTIQGVAQLRYDAGSGGEWHIHHGHIKLGGSVDSRVEFNNRSKKAIRKELGEKISRFGLSVGGDLAASFRECINYINANF